MNKNGLTKCNTRHFLPSVPALHYLNCCQLAGWQQSNCYYHLRYEKGVDAVLVIFTTKGAGWIAFEDNHFRLTEGTLIFVPAHMPMEYAIEDRSLRGEWEFYFLNLNGRHVHHLVDQLSADHCLYHSCRDIPAFTQIFRQLLDPGTENGSLTEDNSSEWELSKTIRNLFDLLISERIFCRNTPSSAPDTAAQIQNYLQTHFAEDLTLEELSRLFYLSKNQVIRIVRHKTGYAPYEYLKRYRLMKACEMLSGTTLMINEIGRRTGYANSSHFTSQFKEMYGLTPKEYRRTFLPDYQNR